MPRPGIKIQLARKLAGLDAEDRREVIEFSRELAGVVEGGGTTAPKAARRKPVKRTKVKPEPEVEDSDDEQDEADDNVDFDDEEED